MEGRVFTLLVPEFKAIGMEPDRRYLVRDREPGCVPVDNHHQNRGSWRGPTVVGSLVARVRDTQVSARAIGAAAAFWKARYDAVVAERAEPQAAIRAIVSITLWLARNRQACACAESGTTGQGARGGGRDVATRGEANLRMLTH